MRRVLAVLFVLATACDPQTTSTPAVSPRDLRLQISRAGCDKAAACEVALGRGYTSADACLALATSGLDCASRYPEITYAADDAAAAAQCVEALSAMDCADLATSWPSACEVFERIGQAVGDSCEGSFCTADLVCVRSTDLGACATCQPAAGVAAACDRDSDCALGLYCSEAMQCTARADDGASCSGDSECLSDWCREATGQCSSAVAPGASCVASDRCAGLRACVGGVCADRLPIGASCSGDGECVLDALCDGGVCTTVDYCATPGVGDSCRAQCVASAYCPTFSSQEPTCQPALQLGDPCDFVLATVEDRCGANAACSLATSQCTPLVDLGDACTSMDTCADRGFCDTSQQPAVCRPLGDVGAACANALQCKTLNCGTTNLCADVGACSMP